MNRNEGSAQFRQLPHVTGHAADTSDNEQRVFVSLLPTQSQYLDIAFPFFIIFNLKLESLQLESLTIVGGLVGECVGIGVVGASFPAVGLSMVVGGTIEGFRDGFTESEGSPVWT